MLCTMSEPKDLRVPIMMSRAEVAAIDRWRREQTDLPSRSEAIRRLTETGLRATSGKNKR
jgi:hypothetical protein